MLLSELLRERGVVYQFSAENLEKITDTPRTLYLGVDPTADSMHVGQLQGILVLRRFLEAGHKVIIIVGGGTGMIGDPGGKSAERNLLDDETLAKNTEALNKQFTQLFGSSTIEESWMMVNNADWLRSLNLLEFLRDTGKHFTVNEMVKRDSVRPRLETPDQSISYTEFSYMLLQAYDFLELFRRYGCTLQVGGSDQWGNIVSGVELIRRVAGGEAFALSWPLLVDKATGKKFGKSEGGATVWLDANKTSPFQFYQFWLNSADDVAEEMLLKMTILEKSAIDAVLEEHLVERGKRIAQKRLAREVTALAHGDEEAKRAEKVSEVLFGDAPLHSLESKSIAQLSSVAPSAEVAAGSALIDALISSGLATSKREARQFVSDGAVMLNGEKLTDDRPLLESDFIEGAALLKRGKRNIAILKLS